MRHLSIDIETKSNLDIKKAGAYKYAQSPDFAILLFAYFASFHLFVTVAEVFPLIAYLGDMIRFLYQINIA